MSMVSRRNLGTGEFLQGFESAGGQVIIKLVFQRRPGKLETSIKYYNTITSCNTLSRFSLMRGRIVK